MRILVAGSMGFEIPIEPDFWVAVGTLALAGVTAILATFTALSVSESKKTRIPAQRPIFALEPSEFMMALGGPMGGQFLHPRISNHGAPATDISTRVMWLDSELGGGSSRDFYIVSLAKDGYAILDVPVSDILAQHKFVKVEVKCKDSVGKPYATTITNGFDKIKGTNTLIAYQNNNWSALNDAIKRANDGVERGLSSIEHSVNDVARKIR